MTKKKKLKLSSKKKIAGVCGGLANYFGISPILVRIIMLLLALCGSLGLWIYLLCWLIMPDS